MKMTGSDSYITRSDPVILGAGIVLQFVKFGPFDCLSTAQIYNTFFIVFYLRKNYYESDPLINDRTVQN